MPGKPTKEIDSVAIRFTGDSGDGMQLTGTKFTEATALAGNDLSTFPDYPAEIRAPAGSLAGVSGFQVHFAAEDIRTPADHPDVLVALNPAALPIRDSSLRVRAPKRAPCTSFAGCARSRSRASGSARCASR